MALSLAEDVAAISLTWFATRHPITAGIIVAICLLLAILAIRYLLRAFGGYPANPGTAASSSGGLT